VSRIQLALNVSDLDSAVDFYSKLFDTPPAKTRPGYANFAIAEPPLKLVLIEHAGATETLNHLGIEVDHRVDVRAAQLRLARSELATTVEHEVSCCYALQDKLWVEAPGGAPWEIYTVLADAEVLAGPDANDATYVDPLGAATVPTGTAAVSRPCC
jgi:catechol 2,3-dioxygenase-like lactoylglutathione lyase family enzyme